MLRLVLLRHGQTQWNMAGKLQGWRDSSLTPQARRQLMSLPRTLLQNSVIYTSDLGRAQATARIVANTTGSYIVTDCRLRERCFGDLDGQMIVPHSNGNCHWQAYHQRYLTPIVAIPGAETDTQLENRIRQWLDAIPDVYRGKTVLVISHGEWLRALKNIVSGIPSWQQGEGIAVNGQPTVIHWYKKSGNALRN
ncbi:histidine phosphatase family protein [Photobacterium nomapromontoriensis]|uniref:histidine phosphatase family protein n=1 Tax=Photobacterium nomapromontoriensis TaxID=2910237 RepID=UPI003D128244